MAPFHVRNKVYIATFKVWRQFSVFAPHIEGSNVDFAPHMEGSHAHFAPHIEQRHNLRDQKRAKLPFLPIKFLSKPLNLRSLYDLSDHF